MEEKEIQCVMEQLFLALAYLHGIEIAHRGVESVIIC